MNELALLDKAIKAMDNAYCPYSNYAVGAALLCADGSVYTGCNIENASFSATVCAERSAIFKAISEGKYDFVKMAVVGGKNKNVDTPAMPCGVCRQVLSEFCGKDFEIIMLSKGEVVKKRLESLLPNAFSLEKNL